MSSRHLKRLQERNLAEQEKEVFSSEEDEEEHQTKSAWDVSNGFVCLLAVTVVNRSSLSLMNQKTLHLMRMANLTHGLNNLILLPNLANRVSKNVPS
jgi:hypothetical protein